MNLKNVFLMAVMLSSCTNGNAEKIAKEKTDSISPVECVNDSVVALNNEQDLVPEGAKLLIKSYPDARLRYENNKIVFPDGYAIVYDDEKKKTFDKQLDEADIEDGFAMQYYMGGGQPPYQADGGRSRNDKFFKKMYGSSSTQVYKNLTTINWFGTKVKVTKINGVDKKLQAVANELAKKPHLKKYLVKPQSFYWRQVRGAKRQSAHSYGIAFDIAVKYSDYWLWSSPKANENTKITYKNSIPNEIVEVFEKHGFVWGGRWYHFDTMHFEYRPEIINAARLKK